MSSNVWSIGIQKHTQNVHIRSTDQFNQVLICKINTPPASEKNSILFPTIPL